MLRIGKLARKLFGSVHDRKVKQLAPIVAKINALADQYKALSDTELQSKTALFKERLAAGESLDDLLVESFALVREASDRILGMRHFDVQLIGAMILHQRGIAEMRTGEGKTLMATLAIYLNALAGKGVHVVTVNDYLAKRDAESLAPLYNFLGLTVGVILNDMDHAARKAAYNCDITYATNNELGFDYLRDNMAYDREQMVQREHYYAIIDEVDSILIDEARTPLIISGPLEDKSEFYNLVDTFILKLEPTDYEVDEKSKTAVFTEVGTEKLEGLLREAGHLKADNLYDIDNVSIVHHLNNALKAHTLFQRDKDYIVRKGEVVIIDEFTGRMMAGRRYSDGLHQALEAKEHVAIQPENQTLASITFQNYFRMYKKLAGMTGTAATEAAEFENIYNLQVVEIPTNLPVIRKDEHDEIYRTEGEKYKAIVKEVLDAHERGQPVLIGTTSIEKSEMLASVLKKAGLKKFQVLNARYHEQEAYIISQAGVPGAVTIATNMAGRGTDIQLGGSLAMRLKQELASIEDEEIRSAKIEQIKADIEVLKKKALDAGGLYVLGTERHESRRIDNQLRGRSGRQGDPGKSKFFLSLEDDLMRIFGSNRMDSMLQRFGLKEDEAIVHPWISKALEKAQKKVEGRHFDARKNILKYDDVMNDQRKVVFEQRMEIIDDSNLDDVIKEMSLATIDSIISEAIPADSYKEQWQLTKLEQQLKETFNLDLPLVEWASADGVNDEDLFAKVKEAVSARQQAKYESYGSEIMHYLQRAILLESIDKLWREHLVDLDHLRSAVGFRGYAQRDPLNEYKMESFELFQHMMQRLQREVVTKLSHIEIVMPEEGAMSLNEFADKQRLSLEANETKEADSRVSRNAICPCGSGKKYKHCHGQIK